MRIIKRIFIFLIIAVALFYAGAGIYFYNKAQKKKTVAIVAKEKPSIVSTELGILKEVFIDFEDRKSGENQPLSNSKPFSGKKSVKLSSENEFGAEINKSFSEIPSFTNLRKVEITLKLWNEKVTPDNAWVFEVVGEDGKVLSWNSMGLPQTLHKWETCTFSFDIDPNHVKNLNRIKTYAWNKNKGTFYVDDIRIKFIGFQAGKTFLINPLRQTTFFYDLENDSSLENKESISDDYSHSGKYSSYLNGKDEYSVTIIKKASEIFNDTIRTVWMTAWLFPLSDDAECTLTLEIRNAEGEPYYWNGKKTSNMKLKKKQWNKVNAAINLYRDDYSKITPEDHLLVYVANNGKAKVYADDFTVSFGDIAERRGDQTYVDMNALGTSAYQFTRNHPPYITSYLKQNNIRNEGSAYLVNIAGQKLGQLKPDQKIFSGNFSGISSGRDELLVISNENINIFHYCTKDSCFKLSGNVFTENKNYSNAEFLTGDFTGDGLHELIIKTGNYLSMFNFSVKGNISCINNTGAIKMNLIAQEEMRDKNIKMLSGKFTGGKNDELLLVSQKGALTVKKFIGSKWSDVVRDSIASFIFGKQSTQIVGRYYSKGHDEILSVYNEKNQTHITLLDVAKNKMQIRKVQNQDLIKNVFDWSDILYNVHLNGKNNSELLSFNNQWRFELKRIAFDNNGFYIASVPEFSGFVSDQNPKYYEFPLLVSGRFTGNQTELLCILYNCADNNFNGKHCKKYDSVPDLPNSVQLYNFSK